MIDDTNYADCLALYNFDHVEKINDYYGVADQ